MVAPKRCIYIPDLIWKVFADVIKLRILRQGYPGLPKEPKSNKCPYKKKENRTQRTGLSGEGQRLRLEDAGFRGSELLLTP